MIKKTRWTVEELDVLHTKYDGNMASVRDLLPNRSLTQIRCKISSLGLAKRTHRRWSDKDILILANKLLKGDTQKEAAKNLNVTRYSVISAVRRRIIHEPAPKSHWQRVEFLNTIVKKPADSLITIPINELLNDDVDSFIDGGYTHASLWISRSCVGQITKDEDGRTFMEVDSEYWLNLLNNRNNFKLHTHGRRSK